MEDETLTEVPEAENGQPEQDDAPRASVPAGEADSVMNRLRKRRAELRADHHLDAAIPGYDGELVARYRPLEWATFRAMAKKVELSKSDRAELLAHADTLIKACDSIWIKDPDDPRSDPKTGLRPVDEDPESPPVKYDDRLADYLGFAINNEAKTGPARQVLFGTFNNDLAVTAHYNEVTDWMNDVTQTVDNEFSGE